MNGKTKTILRRCYPLFAVAFWIGLWWLIAALYGRPLILPTPARMLRALGALMQTGEFYLTILLSLARILVGIVLALALGTLLAILTCKSPFCHHLFSPLLTLFKATPVASIIFLLLLWVGNAWVPFVIALMMALPIVWGNVREGLLQTDAKLLEMAKVFGVPRTQVMKKIYLPSLKPYLLAAARSAVSLAWKAGVAAEVLCVPQRSIGRAIYEGKLYLLTDELFAWTFVVVIVSVLIEEGALALLARAKGAENARRTEGEEADHDRAV